MCSARPGAKTWTRLDVQPPFHLEATVRVLQRRPSNLVDVWEEGYYRRVLTSAGGLVLVEVADEGSVARPDLRFAVRAPASRAVREEARHTLRTMLGLDLDPGVMQELALRERRLRPVALALRGMRPPRFAGLFEAFANVIPFQQLSIDAGMAIVGRLVRRFGTPLERGGRRLYAFPTAGEIAQAPAAALRACGLSAAKAKALRSIARMIDAQGLEAEIAAMSTPDALRALTALPGIGPWSAALVLLRGLGRLEIFPPGDVGAERALRRLLGLRPQGALGPVLERFGDLRGYLYFYGLGAYLLDRGLIRAAQEGAPMPAGPAPPGPSGAPLA